MRPTRAPRIRAWACRGWCAPWTPPRSVCCGCERRTAPRVSSRRGSCPWDLASFLLLAPLVGSASPLEPERARSFELGADAGLLGGRLNGAVTFYDMRSFVVGFGLVFTPSGCCSPTYQSGVEVMNRGIEAMLTAALARGPGLGWDVSLS